MHGICIDVANPMGNISARRLGRLKLGYVRAELRVGQTYPDVPTMLLYGPTSKDEAPTFYIPDGLSVLMVIIGNEPDNEGPSSWYMTPEEYVELYNRIAASVPDWIPICAAGMVNGTEYLNKCWSALKRTPDFVNCHYPPNATFIQQFATTFSRPVVVGEWCYATATTQQEMDDWVKTLTAYTAFDGWFCLSDEMMNGMGMYNNGRLTSYGRLYRRSILRGM